MMPAGHNFQGLWAAMVGVCNSCAQALLDKASQLRSMAIALQ